MTHCVWNNTLCTTVHSCQKSFSRWLWKNSPQSNSFTLAPLLMIRTNIRYGDCLRFGQDCLLFPWDCLILGRVAWYLVRIAWYLAEFAWYWPRSPDICASSVHPQRILSASPLTSQEEAFAHLVFLKEKKRFPPWLPKNLALAVLAMFGGTDELHLKQRFRNIKV